jgi:PilZ domain
MGRVALRRPLTEPMCIDGSFDQELPSNRRVHERLKADDLEWLRGASVKYDAAVRVLDISAGGVLLETEKALKPNSNVVLELTGPERPIVVPSKVLRCRVASLRDILTYEGACAFKRPLTIPELTVKLTSTATQPTVSIAHTAESRVGWRKVVARFADGRVVRGYTNNFDPFKARMQLLTDGRDGESTIIPLSELTALFFVRDLAGDSTRVEAKFFSETPHGRKMEVTLRDNEVIVGSTLSYRVEGHGFFIQPSDTQSNNLSVFVTAAALQHVRYL